MEDPLYREIILEHWQHPQNFGALKNADIDVTETNPLCGDKIRLTMKIEDGKIKDVLFLGEGCAISQASASLFTEEIKKESLDSLKNRGSRCFEIIGNRVDACENEVCSFSFKSIAKRN